MRRQLQAREVEFRHVTLQTWHRISLCSASYPCARWSCRAHLFAGYGTEATADLVARRTIFETLRLEEEHGTQLSITLEKLSGWTGALSP